MNAVTSYVSGVITFRIYNIGLFRLCIKEFLFTFFLENVETAIHGGHRVVLDVDVIISILAILKRKLGLWFESKVHWVGCRIFSIPKLHRSFFDEVVNIETSQKIRYVSFFLTFAFVWITPSDQNFKASEIL